MALSNEKLTILNGTLLIMFSPTGADILFSHSYLSVRLSSQIVSAP